jgi:hypothetical protein
MTEKNQSTQHLRSILRGLLILLGGLAIALGLALGITELRLVMLGSALVPTLLAALVCFLGAVAGLFMVRAAWPGRDKSLSL